MKFVKQLLTLSIALTTTALVAAQPVEYVRICSAYGAGFNYVPGTDTCMNVTTGDARVVTEGGVWRTRVPYQIGSWTKQPQRACREGRVVKIGTFSSTDFTVNAWIRKQTAVVPLKLQSNEFISKVMMSGGLYDPRMPGGRTGNGLGAALCLRALDPAIPEEPPPTPAPDAPPAAPPKYRWATGGLPIACIPMSRTLNMPATYVVDAETSFPSVEPYWVPTDTTPITGSYTYDSHVVVTTDLGAAGDYALTYLDGTEIKPFAGTVTVSACVVTKTLVP